jgi:hypothetical protein
MFNIKKKSGMAVYFNKVKMSTHDREPVLMTSFDDQKGMPNLVSIFDTHYFSKWTEIPRMFSFSQKVGSTTHVIFFLLFGFCR